MNLYSVYVDANFNNDEELNKMEKKYNLKIVDMTKFEIQFCERQNAIYRGPMTYLFIGHWKDLVNYFMYDYFLESVDDLIELVKDIKKLDF